YLCSLHLHHDTPPSDLYTLSLHDALPISRSGGLSQLQPDRRRSRGNADLLPADRRRGRDRPALLRVALRHHCDHGAHVEAEREQDRKSTRLNSSHVKISYAVFCLKKKK